MDGDGGLYYPAVVNSVVRYDGRKILSSIFTVSQFELDPDFSGGDLFTIDPSKAATIFDGDTQLFLKQSTPVVDHPDLDDISAGLNGGSAAALGDGDPGARQGPTFTTDVEDSTSSPAEARPERGSSDKTWFQWIALIAAVVFSVGTVTVFIRSRR